MNTIFGASWCAYCVKAEALLDETGIPYRHVDIDTQEGIDELMEAFEGKPPKTIPQIFLDGKYLGGYEELLVSLAG